MASLGHTVSINKPNAFKTIDYVFIFGHSYLHRLIQKPLYNRLPNIRAVNHKARNDNWLIKLNGIAFIDITISEGIDNHKHNKI